MSHPICKLQLSSSDSHVCLDIYGIIYSYSIMVRNILILFSGYRVMGPRQLTNDKWELLCAHTQHLFGMHFNHLAALLLLTYCTGLAVITKTIGLICNPGNLSWQRWQISIALKEKKKKSNRLDVNSGLDFQHVLGKYFIVIEPSHRRKRKIVLLFS